MRLKFAILSVLAMMAFAEAANGQQVEFLRDVKPIFNKRCVACHGGVKRAGGISFLSREAAIVPAESGETPVVPNRPDASQLIARITSTDESLRMPPADHGPALEASEVEILRRWIAEGAQWETHWAYRPPVAADLPDVSDKAWPRQPLDHFILASLEQASLEPSPEADRRTWLRRVSFDLVGLPPSPEEIQAFVGDNSETAYEKVVDRLLSSPSCGERWASVWLDLARYSDTVGFERDPTRSIWPWRDWVVDAYNADMPYDQFLVKQLAGDLLPNATFADKVASAFHRNTQTNTECGTDDEEFRLNALFDRLNTTWEGLMSTSFRCVQCHNHPYDPFTQEEFYQVLALFNSTQDNDCNEDFPLLSVPLDRGDWEKAAQIDRERKELRERLHSKAMQLSQTSVWKPLRASSATSTGLTTMTVRDIDGVPEVTATGNVRLRGVFTLEFPLAAGRLTAIRIEALPFDAERAAVSSELGFVLSRLTARLRVGEQVSDITFVGAFDDDPTAFYPVEATFSEDLPGWSAYPRFHRPRRAVFAVEQPIDVPEGARLELTLEQNAASTGITAQVIRRARYAISDDQLWSNLVREQATDREIIRELESARGAIPSVSVPVAREQHASQLRETKLFIRGNFLDHGAKVEPGIPAILGGQPIRSRLEFAEWMTRPEHPLTARTAVNRVWQQLFGRGLVEIVEAFGSAGRPPSHPELLDTLAVRFATTMKWRQKELLRELVLSATYRQSSVLTPTLAQRDRENVLLSRGPRQRLSAEMLRDQALAASGLLSLKRAGPPVMPHQPEGIWRTVYNASQWKTSAGQDAYRRALYTFSRRTSGYPSFQIFDSPTRDICTSRRLTTNTPLQALVTLNDPVFIESAKALAERMLAADEGLEGRIRFGYELAAGHPLPDASLPPLLKLHATALARFQNDAESAGKLAGDPDGAAMVVVANALLNLDVVLTK